MVGIAAGGKGLTLVPLLGPIGGGLATGAALASSVAVVAAGGAASSAARTTSLLPLFLEGGKDTIVTILVVLLGVTTFGVTTNPQAADAMLQLAMLLSSLSFFTRKEKNYRKKITKMVELKKYFERL